MADKKFIYKPSGVDQLIMFIILLATVTFGGLIYMDYTDSFPTRNNNASPELKELLSAQKELEAAIEKAKHEQDN